MNESTVIHKSSVEFNGRDYINLVSPLSHWSLASYNGQMQCHGNRECGQYVEGTHQRQEHY